jgi:hypothetical protein
MAISVKLSPRTVPSMSRARLNIPPDIILERRKTVSRRELKRVTEERNEARQWGIDWEECERKLKELAPKAQAGDEEAKAKFVVVLGELEAMRQKNLEAENVKALEAKAKKKECKHFKALILRAKAGDKEAKNLILEAKLNSHSKDDEEFEFWHAFATHISARIYYICLMNQSPPCVEITQIGSLMQVLRRAIEMLEEAHSGSHTEPEPIFTIQDEIESNPAIKKIVMESIDEVFEQVTDQESPLRKAIEACKKMEKTTKEQGAKSKKPSRKKT